MSLILALEPDHRQGSRLADLIRTEVKADVQVVDSRDAAVAAINERIPDVVLLSSLLSPRDEEDLLRHLRLLEGAEHVQTHSIPVTIDAVQEEPAGSGGLFGRLLRKPKKQETFSHYSPSMFASEVISYVARAEEAKTELRQRERDATRKLSSPPPANEPRITLETPPLVDPLDAFTWKPRGYAKTGAEAPQSQTSVPDSGSTGIEETGIADAAAVERQRDEAEAMRRRLEAEAAAAREQAARVAEAALERAREEERLRAEEERRRLEAEAAAERERLLREAEAAAERAREEERRRVEEDRRRLEMEAAAERDRLRREAEEAAERARQAERDRLEQERLRLEAEQAAERDRLRREAEAAAERARQAERDRLEEELRRREAKEAAERERLKREAEEAAERARQVERQRLEQERLRLEAEQAAERDRLQREAEAAAERARQAEWKREEAERQRIAAEAAAQREKEHAEQLRLAAEQAERERQQREREQRERERVAAEQAERARQEKAAAAARERQAREREKEDAAARRREAHREKSRIAKAKEPSVPPPAAATPSTGPAPKPSRKPRGVPAIPDEPFADFQAVLSGTGSDSIFRLMPIATWARPERPRSSGRVDEPEEAAEFLGKLKVPVHVARMEYPQGCRIRRVRVPATAEELARYASGPVILSRRRLEELRTSG